MERHLSNGANMVPDILKSEEKRKWMFMDTGSLQEPKPNVFQQTSDLFF